MTQAIAPTDPAVAKESARILIETQSVLFNAEDPFVFTSGRISPVYTDCRRLISFPEQRSTLMDFAADILRPLNLDYIAGGETAGIPYAAFLSERLQKPMLYVRKKPKGFGRMAQIEGHLEESQEGEKGPHVLLAEDLQTDGGSKELFVDVLRQAGATVQHGFVVFHYGILPQSQENMKNLGITLHALCTWWDVFAVAKEESYFDSKTLDVVEGFLHDPDSWDDKSKAG